MESIFYIYISDMNLSYFNQNRFLDQLQYHVAYFIFHSFLFEVLFDFLHYWLHRIVHRYSELYKFIHKQHHLHTRPTVLSTFDETIYELILTNALPTYFAYLSLRLVFGIILTDAEFCCITVYKAYIEISGHCGKKLGSSSSFPQFIWLPKYLGS